MTAVTANVSAVIVTHNSARYLPACLASLQQQGRTPRVIVVDNASRAEERPRLLPGDDGEVIANSWNRGFAPAVNQGFARVHTPYVLVLNPDVRLLPEALAQMVSFLEHTPNVAAVSPRFWWDTERTVLLPLTGEPTLTRVMLRVLATHSALVRRMVDRWLIRQARRWWFARHAMAVPAISYGCVLLPSAALARIGPLDAQFPFYYEEVEWSQRARRAGYQLCMLPSAEAIHAFGHSSRGGSPRVQRWANVSSRRYWRGRYGRAGAKLVAALSTAAVPQIAAPVADLGALDQPPKLSWPSVKQPQIIQVAFDPLFESAATIFPPGSTFEWPAALWEEMPAGTYHARLLSGPSCRPVTYWRWQRSAHEEQSG